MVLYHIPVPRRSCTYPPTGKLGKILCKGENGPNLTSFQCSAIIKLLFANKLKIPLPQPYASIMCSVYCAQGLHLMPAFLLLSWDLLLQSLSFMSFSYQEPKPIVKPKICLLFVLILLISLERHYFLDVFKESSQRNLKCIC